MATKFDELMLDPEFRKLYAIEGLIADAAQLICDLLERRKMRRADLARLLNKTPAFVSQLLNGKTNMTVRTLAEVMHALGASVKIDAYDEGKSSCENIDDTEMHTLRIHISTDSIYNYASKGLLPTFKLDNQLAVREYGPNFRWEGPGITPLKPRGSDTRSGYAA
jgi:transcriptional regulator with XRE-family HTH domain